MENPWKKHYLTKRAEGRFLLKSVCCPDLSLASNAVIDRIQNRTFMRLFGKAGMAHGTAVLDIGCGGGRWVHRLSESGMQVFGMDISYTALLQNDIKYRGKLVTGSADRLPFDDSCFGCVSTVTVIQHMAYDAQERAGREILRIMKNDGYWLFLEHVTPDGSAGRDVDWPGVFPRSRTEWTRFFSELNMEIIEIGRFFYLPCTRFALDRIEAMERAYVAFRKRKKQSAATRIEDAGGPPATGNTTGQDAEHRRHGVFRKLKATVMNVPVALDFALSPSLERHAGTHIAILARKRTP